MKQIVCLSNEAWSHSPGRTQQLITRLKHTQVLFFSPSGSWREIRFRAKGRAVKPNITVYPLPPLLLPADERYGPLFRLEQLRLARFIAGRMEEHRFRSPLLWCACPEQVHLLDRLDYDGLIYDCDREWDDLPPAWEGSLASAADVVFAASPELAERLSPCSGNIALLPNGVTYPLFSRIAAPSRPRPEDPVLGWAGTIHGNLDLSPALCRSGAAPLDLPPPGTPGTKSTPAPAGPAPQCTFSPPLPPDGGAGASVPVPGAAELPAGGPAGLRRDPHPDL